MLIIKNIYMNVNYNRIYLYVCVCVCVCVRENKSNYKLLFTFMPVKFVLEIFQVF